ncbi:hybrid sensor histidine kinase/response regulator [Granulosicoccus antarcticus]|uniref:histidine kinase n=1 Tax=Granulosicoccus antarcticus IMCC3135 TaxID=1192854 RepID=A0A2Z2NN98_9GAMM|nr:PAS domain-containing sensor histidine kinase [Granulosicoccus antarcticus]ASJ72699.1 Blue-light-activated protein [Granulosicoccus antarcticus IMCC3135]
MDNQSLLEELEELRASNKELLVCKQQLDAIMDNAPVEIYLKDRNGRYLRINKEFERIFGVQGKELIGLLPEDVHDPKLASSTRSHDLFVLNSGLVERREEVAMLAGDNQLHTLLTIKFPVFDDDGEINGLGAIVTDISEHKRLEETVRRAQRMDAIGQLTGGIAHDFNNLLGIVMGNLELLEAFVNHSEKARFHVESALKGATRGAELTRKLLSFSRPTGGIAKTVCLNEFIREMEAIAVKSLTVSIKLDIQLADDLWTVRINPGEMEDTLLNLSLNARDAVPAGGQIFIRTSNEVIDESYVRNNPQARTGEFVMLSVRDNGHGMTPEILKRAVEPFFTMKEANEGTGLGLSMVYGFIKRSGGHMKILSAPGEGTDVRLYLPRVYEDVASDLKNQAQTTMHGGNETILIVDDEKALVEIAVFHLQSLGYKTYTANDSQQALEHLQAHDEIDLLFVDVIMPGEMDGLELAMNIQAIRPNLKVLLTSGFTRKHHDVVDGDSGLKSTLLSGLLKKPYDKSELSAAVRGVLDVKAGR